MSANVSVFLHIRRIHPREAWLRASRHGQRAQHEWMEDQNWKRALDKWRAVAAIRHGAAYGSVSASDFAAVLASVFQVCLGRSASASPNLICCALSPLSLSGRTNRGGNRGNDHSAQTRGNVRGEGAARRRPGSGRGGGAGRGQTTGKWKGAAREGKAMGRENNNGGAAPAAGQGKRAMPANLGVGPENSFCQAKHRQDNGKCIYTGAKYS